MSWYDKARGIIERVHRDLPVDMPFAERRTAIRNCYPWGARENHPYKQWCKAQREYLARFAPQKPMNEGLFATQSKAPDVSTEGR